MVLFYKTKCLKIKCSLLFQVFQLFCSSKIFLHAKKFWSTQMQWISAFIYQNCRNNKLLIIPTAQNLLHMGRIIFVSETFLLSTGQIRWSSPENISWDMHHLLMKALHCSQAVRQQFCYTMLFLPAIYFLLDWCANSFSEAEKCWTLIKMWSMLV